MDNIIKFFLYFIFFAVIHSLLATDHVKNKVEKLPGKAFRYYRLLYSLISIPLFAPALMVWISYSNSTPVIYVIPQNLYPVVVLVRLGAIGMFGYALLQTDVLEFIGIKRQKKKVLVTRGAYAKVRHPLYTAGILLLVTQMQMTLLDLTAVLLITGYFLIGAFIEEKRLLSTFGDEYRKYQEQVSMFIPVKWFMKKISRI
ncbi:MAG: isoprenylcysteine carboxylmethyltransferase family protein [Candidatus Methanoperedens sp.]|nr:isoprenylcysteine carboxylmethyltransferase family protein [Candidatus Methanoperedens sp.]